VIARVLLGLGLLLCAADARAVREQYGPFVPGEQPRPFPLIKLTAVPNASDGPAPPRCDEFVHRAEKVTALKVDWTADRTAGVTLSCNGSKLFSGPLKGGSPAVGSDAYTADLNSDGFSDYVLFTYSGGCGLAGEITWVTFLLSSSTGYRSTGVLSYAAEPSDFIAIKDRACLVHTSFVYGPAGKDGRQHNYWVYNLLSFSGTELVLANDLDSGFPKWVLFSFAPNHRDTDQLTAAQRRLSLKQILEAE
jgi:hypothetical protein